LKWYRYTVLFDGWGLSEWTYASKKNIEEMKEENGTLDK